MSEPFTQRRASATRFLDMCFAVAILIAPISFVVGGLLDPVVHVTSGSANIAAYAAANPVTNAVHLAAFVIGSFVLPASVVGIARLAMPASPWLPFSALTAQEDLTLQMALLGGGDLLGTLWERFNDDAVMTFFLVVYITGHLLAYVVFAVALHRARLIPAWAAWTLASSSPLTLAFFATRQRSEVIGFAFEVLFCATFVIGSVPAALAAYRRTH
jgi:hypothetical protein